MVIVFSSLGQVLLMLPVASSEGFCVGFTTRICEVGGGDLFMFLDNGLGEGLASTFV